MKAELVALDVDCKEAEWFRDLLNDIPMLGKPIHVILISVITNLQIAKI